MKVRRGDQRSFRVNVRYPASEAETLDGDALIALRRNRTELGVGLLRGSVIERTSEADTDRVSDSDTVSECFGKERETMRGERRYKAARLEIDAGCGVEAEVLTRGELLVVELMRPNGHFLGN